MSKRYRNKKTYDDSEAIGLVIFAGISYIISFITKYYIQIIITIFSLLILFFLIKYRKKIILKIIKLKDNVNIKKIKKKTILYSKILLLNTEYKLPNLKQLCYSYPVRFKNELQTCNIDDYLMKAIYDNLDEIKEYLEEYKNCLNQYVIYNKNYENLKKYITEEEALKNKISFKKYYKYQNMIFEREKQKKFYQFNIQINIFYKSKKGRVYKEINQNYNKVQFQNIYKKYVSLQNSRELYEINSRIERAKISDSVRYDVFMRDGNKCCICGRKQSDGVILEVDHIIPDSKGGKSTIDNLQTLCDRCNGGKSNKM